MVTKGSITYYASCETRNQRVHPKMCINIIAEYCIEVQYLSTLQTEGPIKKTFRDFLQVQILPT